MCLVLVLILVLLLLIYYVRHQLFVNLVLLIELVLVMFQLVLLINELIPDLFGDRDAPSLVIC